MSILTIDIETLATNDQTIIAEIAKTVAPPGNIKLPESIKKWHEEHGEQALNDAVSKTSFDGLYGCIACIGWAFDDDAPTCTGHGLTEREAITSFYDALETYIDQNYVGGARDIIVCGHNIAGFDMPFLKARSIILGIKPPAFLIRAMNAKAWDNNIADTMLMWSQDRDKRVSLDKLCRALGIAGKDGFDGSMVAETWPDDPRRVIEYCMDDVLRHRVVYKRLMWLAGDQAGVAGAFARALE